MATVKGVWEFFDTPSDIVIDDEIILVNFSSDGLQFSKFVFTKPTGSRLSFYYYGETPREVYFYKAWVSPEGISYPIGWVSDALKTIDFGETEQAVPNEFHKWLTANATQHIPTAPIASITYGGAELTTLSVDETVSLHTNGKRMGGDVEITITAKDYNGSVDIKGEPNEPGEGGTIVLQEKIITENGEYAPDIGYDGFSKVIINIPIPEDSPLPIEVKTESEMTALLETAQIGSIYKYTGGSGIYESGALYVVEESE